MIKSLLIIGAGGHGKVIADIALKMGKWDKINFLDDNEQNELFMSIPIIGKTNEVIRFKTTHDIIVGIGNNQTRSKFHRMLEKEGVFIPKIVHPNSVVGSQVTISDGCVIMGGVVINSNTYIGRGCIVNTGATIDHDCFIEDFVHISPGVHVAGNVHIGRESWLGIGSIVSNNIHIALKSKIGAGAVVIRDIAETGVYVGVPAKKIK